MPIPRSKRSWPSGERISLPRKFTNCESAAQAQQVQKIMSGKNAVFILTPESSVCFDLRLGGHQQSYRRCGPCLIVRWCGEELMELWFRVARLARAGPGESRH